MLLAPNFLIGVEMIKIRVRDRTAVVTLRQRLP